MTIKEIEEKFRQDTLWLMAELKQVELANAYSKYLDKYIMKKFEEGPTVESQGRIFKMLADRNVVTLKPTFHHLSILDSALQMQGAEPIGYYVQILQPLFNEIYEELSNQRVSHPQPVKAQDLKPKPPNQTDTGYFIALNKKRQVMLNGTFVLSNPHFAGENESFIEYVIAHADTKLTKASMEAELNIKFKKPFSSILNDLGFKGEIRKLFFDTSKNVVKFRNFVPESELVELGIDANQLAKELSVLDGNTEKEEEGERNTEK